MTKLLKLIILIGFVFLTSCKSYKDLVLLDDLKEEQSFLNDQPPYTPDYIVKKGDNLYVSILSQNPEMNLLYNPASQNNGGETGTQQMYGSLASQYINGYLVDKGGNISLPILGKIHVEGVSIPIVESQVKVKALEYLKDPTVKVKLLNYKVTVLGEVNMPGTYYNYDKSISVLDALSMAKGITDFAQTDKVLVLRHTDKGTKTYRLNLRSSSNLLNSEAYFLQPDDIIYVEPGKNKNARLRSPSAVLIFSGITTLALVLSLFIRR